ncbi:MAG: hypothetical protein ABIO70_20890 [Pseudomonadota bacterium]
MDRTHPRPLSRGAILALGALLSGCADSSVQADWSLVAAYDASSLVGLEKDPEDENPNSYVWLSAPGMTASCGIAKAPDGLGIFEAEAIANQLSPVLAVVLAWSGEGAPPVLSPAGVRVALGRDDPEFILQPALEPRYAMVHIEGVGLTRYKQLIRTQVQMELCMEHKTGRSWIGGGAKSIRQAFLLDPPDVGGPDRRYFGGQRDPVPALLGPPDACLFRDEVLDEPGNVGTQGQGSLDLVPSDLWGASLRWCDDLVGEPAAAPPQPPIPLRLSEGEGEAPAWKPPGWRDLEVNIGPGESEPQVLVDLTWDGVPLMASAPLFRPLPPDEAGEARYGLADMLANVPGSYPQLGTRDDAGRYTVLMVPNWQIVEGLRRMAAADPSPRPTGGRGVQDGVGYLLQHPEMLFVQVPASGGGDGATWVDLAAPLTGDPHGLRAWGYSVGMRSGRSPIVLPREEPPTWALVKEAQRARQQGLVLAFGAVLALLGLAGLRRVGDLWARIPEERADYWPGQGLDEDAGGPGKPKAPEEKK